VSYFENKNIWIIGASSGIGEGFVQHLSKINCNLIISARREEELERVKKECEGPAQITILPLDLADAHSLEEKTRAAEKCFGGVDIFISSGGISQRSRVVETSMAVHRQIMEVNYFGSIAISTYLLPAMTERKSGHHVIITSAVGIISTPLRSGYAASKHALHGFYDAMRAESHRDNIKVSLICPGYVLTNISFNALEGDGSKQNKLDEGQANGLTVDQLITKCLKVITAQKEEVYFGGLKEVLGIYIKRFFPSLFSKIVRKMNVT
jgi:short-subunit dehydrogenase